MICRGLGNCAYCAHKNKAACFQRIDCPYTNSRHTIMAVNTSEGVVKSSGVARFSVNLGMLIIAVFLLPVMISVARHYMSDNQSKSWWELRRDSSLQAPAPAEFSDAVIQVYAARAARWRGAFGVHTWIAVKPSGDSAYTRIEVMGDRKSVV